MDAELQECISCSFIKSGVRTQSCEKGRVYNWVSGKCVKKMFNGFTNGDCKSPCETQVQYTGILPVGLKECGGKYYFDTSGCGVVDMALSALDILKEFSTQKDLLEIIKYLPKM